MANRKEAFQSAVKKQLAGNKNHGWGVEDSLAVIVAMVADEAGEAPDKEWQDTIKVVVNPSQFRQLLETKGLLAKSEAKRASTAKGLLDGLA